MFSSDSKSVIQSIPPEDRANGLEGVSLPEDPLPVERALGVKWCVESDSLQFRISLPDKPLAIQNGYGQCSYLRLVDDKGVVSCSVVMSKYRVVSLKPITIPRLAPSATMVSVKISILLMKELNLSDVVEFYWTGSKIVLRYIANVARRFHIYGANRVKQNRDYWMMSV